MDDLDRLVRDYGNEGPGGYGPRLSPPVATPLPMTSRAAAVVHANRRDVSALAELAQSGSSHVREQAVEALAELGGPSAQAALIGALSHEDPWVRRAAARRLGTGAGRDAIEPLMARLADEDIFVRQAAATALQRRGYTSAVPARSRRQIADVPEADEYPIRKGLALRAVGIVSSSSASSAS